MERDEKERNEEINDPHAGTDGNTKREQEATLREEGQRLPAGTDFNESGFVANEVNDNPSVVQENLPSFLKNNQQLKNTERKQGNGVTAEPSFKRTAKKTMNNDITTSRVGTPITSLSESTLAPTSLKKEPTQKEPTITSVTPFIQPTGVSYKLTPDGWTTTANKWNENTPYEPTDRFAAKNTTDPGKESTSKKVGGADPVNLELLRRVRDLCLNHFNRSEQINQNRRKYETTLQGLSPDSLEYQKLSDLIFLSQEAISCHKNYIAYLTSHQQELSHREAKIGTDLKVWEQLENHPNKIERLMEQLPENYEKLAHCQNELQKVNDEIAKIDDPILRVHNQEEYNRLLEQRDQFQNKISSYHNTIKENKELASLTNYNWPKIIKIVELRKNIKARKLLNPEAPQIEYLEKEIESIRATLLRRLGDELPEEIIKGYLHSAALFQQAVERLDANPSDVDAPNLALAATSLFEGLQEAQKPNPNEQYCKDLFNVSELIEKGIQAKEGASVTVGSCMIDQGVAFSGAAYTIIKEQEQSSMLPFEPEIVREYAQKNVLGYTKLTQEFHEIADFYQQEENKWRDKESINEGKNIDERLRDKSTSALVIAVNNVKKFGDSDPCITWSLNAARSYLQAADFNDPNQHLYNAAAEAFSDTVEAYRDNRFDEAKAYREEGFRFLEEARKTHESQSY